MWHFTREATRLAKPQTTRKTTSLQYVFTCYILFPLSEAPWTGRHGRTGFFWGGCALWRLDHSQRNGTRSSRLRSDHHSQIQQRRAKDEPLSCRGEAEGCCSQNNMSFWYSYIFSSWNQTLVNSGLSDFMLARQHNQTLVGWSAAAPDSQANVFF